MLKRVKQVFVNVAAVLVVLTTGTNTLEATPEHPLWVADQGWKAAGQVQLGDELWTRSGERVAVTGIEPKQGRFTVFNFEVEGFHAYFVGNDAVLGHNACAFADTRKFSHYIFKEGADHGKDVLFRALGYGGEHADDLARLYSQQATKKFKAGQYRLGKKDQYGQRIEIDIEVPGIGAASGKTGKFVSGWMIREDGSITLNTPFTGFSN